MLRAAFMLAALGFGDTPLHNRPASLMVEFKHPEQCGPVFFEKSDITISNWRLQKPLVAECAKRGTGLNRFKAEASFFGYDLSSVRDTGAVGVAVQAKWVTQESREDLHRPHTHDVILDFGETEKIQTDTYSMEVTACR